VSLGRTPEADHEAEPEWSLDPRAICAGASAMSAPAHRRRSPQFCEAFDLIRQYAVGKGWVPIGWRDWTVGPWRIRVNGTPTQRGQIPPYHALVEHQHIVSLLLISPLGGRVGGWAQGEDDFIAAMRAELKV
jgi:hypothetical protein